MGVQVSCHYCVFYPEIEKGTQYCISIENLNPNLMGIYDESHNKLFREYQNLFNIQFDTLSFNKISTYLCSDCFEARFNSTQKWKDYRQKFEKNGKIYLLSVDYKDKAYFKSQLPL